MALPRQRLGARVATRAGQPPGPAFNLKFKIEGMARSLPPMISPLAAWLFMALPAGRRLGSLERGRAGLRQRFGPGPARLKINVPENSGPNFKQMCHLTTVNMASQHKLPILSQWPRLKDKIARNEFEKIVLSGMSGEDIVSYDRYFLSETGKDVYDGMEGDFLKHWFLTLSNHLLVTQKSNPTLSSIAV